MKKYKYLILFCCLFLFNIESSFAHPGRTDSKGCHTCKTNCASWGLYDNEYHCHNGNTYSNSKGQVFDSNGNIINNNDNDEEDIPNIPIEEKSNDNTLKSLTIDNNNITISDNMVYNTYNEKIKINVETNDNKASYTISNDTLQIGKNNIFIKVTAENGARKTYWLLVNRLTLSNNTNIKILIDNKEIEFINDKATVTVSSDTEKLNYDYILEDEKSQVEISDLPKLNQGNNIITFKVTAEDGTEKNYEITVYKPDLEQNQNETLNDNKVNDENKANTNNDDNYSLGEGLICLVGIGAISYGTFYCIKKYKK